MEDQKINEEHVDAAFDTVEKLRRYAWNMPLAEVAALSERVRVEIMITKTMSAHQKRWYRAYSDYLEEVVEERIEKEKLPRDQFHSWVLRYIRGCLGDD